MTPAGIEPATFGFAAQHLNHCATAVPLHRIYVQLIFRNSFQTVFERNTVTSLCYWRVASCLHVGTECCSVCHVSFRIWNYKRVKVLCCVRGKCAWQRQGFEASRAQTIPGKSILRSRYSLFDSSLVSLSSLSRLLCDISSNRPAI